MSTTDDRNHIGNQDRLLVNTPKQQSLTIMNGHMTKSYRKSGFALPVAIIAKCEEKLFLAQKNIIWRKLVAKKNLL